MVEGSRQGKRQVGRWGYALGALAMLVFETAPMALELPAADGGLRLWLRHWAFFAGFLPLAVFPLQVVFSWWGFKPGEASREAAHRTLIFLAGALGAVLLEAPIVVWLAWPLMTLFFPLLCALCVVCFLMLWWNFKRIPERAPGQTVEELNV